MAIPDIKIYDVLWFHQKGELLFFGTSRPVVERFRKLFRHAFERSMIEKNHFTGISHLELARDVESQVLSLSATRSLVSFDESEDGDYDYEDGAGDEGAPEAAVDASADANANDESAD